MAKKNADKTKELQAEYKRLAKKADQRIVRLEKLSQDPLYSNVDKYALARAKKDIEHIFGEGSTRFNKKIDNYNSLVGAINDVNTFLKSPSSTKKGITNTYKKKADAANRTFGTSFTWQEYADYYQSGTADKLTSKMTYKEALKKVGKMQKSKKTQEQIIQDIQSKKGQNYKVSKKDINSEIYHKLMAQKLTINDLGD